MDLPQDLVEYTLALMPGCARQLGAAKANRHLHSLFSNTAVKISAKDPDLPLWMLERILSDIMAGQCDQANTGLDQGKSLALLMEARAAAGDIPGVQLLRSKGLAWTDKMCMAAAAGGHVQLLRWLRSGKSSRCPWGSVKACAEAAAGGGHLQALQFILQEQFLCAWDISLCAEVAAAAGHLECLQWLASQTGGCPLDAGACAEAAAAGNLDCLHWLRTRGFAWDAKTCILAAAGAGQINILQYLAERTPGSCWDEWASVVAAHAGRLPVLRWLHSKGLPWDEKTCTAAAAAGHLEVLRFLRGEEVPCPWDGTTTTAAAKAGHLSILMWTQQAEPPCELDPAACLEAAKYRHPDVTRWLLQEFAW